MTIHPCRPKWKGIMTDRRRFNDQMHHQPVDRCFNMEFGYWEENFKAWSIFRDNGIKNNEQADILFNFDKMGRDMGLRRETKFWMQPPFGHGTACTSCHSRKGRDRWALHQRMPGPVQDPGRCTTA